MARPDLRLLVPALLRPVGEQLLAMVEPQPGDLCLDAGATAAVMPALLARRARECIAVAESPDVLGEVRDEAALLHLDNVVPLLSRPDALSLPDGIVQVVTSLFVPMTTETLAELLRVLDPERGRLACAVSVELPGVTLGGAMPGTAGLRVEEATVRDVARFDGAAHYAAATGVAADEELLRPHLAADGTIRIPVEVRTLRG